jgi:hypothetical protein
MGSQGEECLPQMGQFLNRRLGIHMGPRPLKKSAEEQEAVAAREEEEL